jgi:phospholipid transport system substrate-binding protein
MKWLMAVLAALLIAPAVHADDIAPDTMVRGVTNEVLEIVRKDKELQSGNTRKAIDLVQAKVLPHFNFTRMTSLAVGKDWRKATPAQQAALIEEFRTLLVRTYSKALTEYRDQTIEYKPLKMQAGDTDVTLHTRINQRGAKPVQLDYNLEKVEQGWKVYDISVGGVSLVTNYRSSFAQEVSANGIDGLIKSLRDKNQGGDAPVVKKQ